MEAPIKRFLVKRAKMRTEWDVHFENSVFSVPEFYTGPEEALEMVLKKLFPDHDSYVESSANLDIGEFVYYAFIGSSVNKITTKKKIRSEKGEKLTLFTMLKGEMLENNFSLQKVEFIGDRKIRVVAMPLNVSANVLEFPETVTPEEIVAEFIKQRGTV